MLINQSKHYTITTCQKKGDTLSSSYNFSTSVTSTVAWHHKRRDISPRDHQWTTWSVRLIRVTSLINSRHLNQSHSDTLVACQLS